MAKVRVRCACGSHVVGVAGDFTSCGNCGESIVIPDPRVAAERRKEMPPVTPPVPPKPAERKPSPPAPDGTAWQVMKSDIRHLAGKPPLAAESKIEEDIRAVSESAVKAVSTAKATVAAASEKVAGKIDRRYRNLYGVASTVQILLVFFAALMLLVALVLLITGQVAAMIFIPSCLVAAASVLPLWVIMELCKCVCGIGSDIAKIKETSGEAKQLLN